MKLRDYQEACVHAILSNIKQGVRKQLVVMPTGCGKTVCFAQLPEYVKRVGKKTLVLAHREELLEQAKEKIELIAPELSVAIEQGGQVAEPENDVIIASVPTIGRAGSERIKKFDPAHFGLIICDESHHASSSSYRNVFDYFRCNKSGTDLGNTAPVLVGFTATPNRADSIGLDVVFDKIVFKYDLKEAIDQKYLADIKAYTVYTDDSLEGVSTRAGDFALGELSNAVNTERRNRLIVESYRDVSDKQTAIAFCVDVQHTEDLRDMFREYGYKAEMVIGSTDKEERKETIAKLKKQEIDVVTNCMTLTEGFDAPQIRTVLLARPTKSSSLFLQMIGRGTRIAEGKSEVNVIDFVDNTGKNSIITSSSLIGLSKPVRAKGHSIMQLKEKFDTLKGMTLNLDPEKIDLDDIEKEIKRVDIFAQARLHESVKLFSEFTWTPYGDDGFTISLGSVGNNGNNVIVEIQKNLLGKYDVVTTELKPTKPSHLNGYKKYSRQQVEIAQLDTRSEANTFKFADAYIKKEFPSAASLVGQNSTWRKEPPTEKQIKFLRKAGFPGAEKISKGEASNMISKLIAQRKK